MHQPLPLKITSPTRKHSRLFRSIGALRNGSPFPSPALIVLSEVAVATACRSLPTRRSSDLRRTRDSSHSNDTNQRASFPEQSTPPVVHRRDILRVPAFPGFFIFHCSLPFHPTRQCINHCPLKSRPQLASTHGYSGLLEPLGMARPFLRQL